jgi:16S rRNA (uracil1498-N3)-methyltransferase
MKHFLLPENFSGESEFHLDREDSHYLKNVLRFKEGDSFKAVDRSGVVWNAIFSRFEGKKLVLLLEKSKTEKSNSAKEKNPKIILWQCLPKGKKMDLIVRQATEAGVSEIQPVMSEFSLVSYDKKGWKAKEERYSKIAREAFQQSGSDRIPVIKEPVKLTSLEINEKDEIGLFFHQISIDNISLHKYLFSCPEKIILIIGPEGGLSDNEIKHLRENHFQPAYLGDNVLRTETAALFAVAAVKTILLEKESWTTV